MRRAHFDKNSQPVRNLFTNPSFETSSGLVNVRTNLALNPSFEDASGTVTVRTNMLTNPSLESGSGSVRVRTNLFNGTATVLGAGASQTTGVSYDGSVWTRVSTTTVGHGVRFRTNQSDLVNGATYATEIELANDGAASVSVSLDWCDSVISGGQQTLQPGERRRVTMTGSKATYDATYNFADLTLNTADTSILWREVLIEKEIIRGPYFNGATTPSSLNLAHGKPVSGATTSAILTNGGTHSAKYGQGPEGLQNVQVDLGSVVPLDTVKVWHYYDDGRTYNATKTEISADGTNWTTIFDSAVSGTYAETSAGKTHTFSLQNVRYIRDWTNGSTSNTGNHWVEIQAFNVGFSDFTYAWTGTANASTSTQSSPGVTNWLAAGVNTAMWQSGTLSFLGSKCGAITTTGANGDGTYHADVTVTAGTTYTWSSWIKLTATVPTMSGVLRWKDSSQTIISDGGTTVHTSLVVGNWVRVSVSGVAPTGATFLQPMWRIYATHTPTTFYIDASMVEARITAGPYFDGANTLSNLCPNPSFETDTTGWKTYLATISRDTTYSYSGVASLKVVTTGAGGPSLEPQISAIKGETYTLSMWVRTPSGQGMAIQMLQYDAANVNRKTTSVSFTGTGNWQRVSVTDVVVSTATKITPYVYATASGVTFWVDDVLVERGSILNPYFTGTGDFTYSWTGTANASTSVQNGTLVTTTSTGSVAPVSATDWKLSGVKSLRLIPTVSSTYDTFTALSGDTGAMRLGMVAGKTYTISGTCHMIAPQSGTPSARARSIVLFYKSAADQNYSEVKSTQPANTAGTTRVSLTFTLPTTVTEAFVRLYNGARAGEGDVWWDDVLIEETSVLQPYFDGTNTITNVCTNPSVETDTANWSYWSGGSGAASGSRQTSGGYVGTAFYRLNYTTSQTGVDQKGGVYVDSPVVTGVTYSASARVRPSKSQTMRMSIEWVTAAMDIIVSVVNGSDVALTAGVWNELKIENNVAPTGAAYLRTTFYSSSTGSLWLAGDNLDVDALLVERGSKVSGPYYEGTGDYTYSWSGSANASTSIQRAPAIVGTSYVSTLSRAYQSSMNLTGASKLIRIRPTHASNGDSFAELNNMLSGTVFKPNTTYTISGDRTIVAPQTNINGTMHFRVNIGNSELLVTPIASVQNVAGTQRVMAKFTTGTGTSLGFIRVYNGSYEGGGDVWWDNIMIVEGDNTRGYMDGSKPFAKWEGAANASVSVGYPPAT